MGVIQFIQNILNFVNVALIPFIIALAFLFFVFNAARYFILGAANPESREKAKQLALWGILAFVFILSLWGIVNLLLVGLGLKSSFPIAPDYIGDPYFDADDVGRLSPPDDPYFDPDDVGTIDD